ncbi:MAG: alpha/beta hydrolase [Syntrophales bacterium]|jgi:pimeloyl-ACP methyl ester carboxylesterase|nr:alpha/beta hydrolase [Syntrophales bacterium]MDY0043810.1 alpha/beta hydrolase [Syntrophales bacterium]
MNFEDRVQHGFVENDGVKIHYASVGEGPLMIMIHGFPDYWYTWHRQMEDLSRHYHCVAIDTRGYNLSDKPEGIDKYAMHLLVGDVAAVIGHFNEKKAIIVGHDWGGAISWAFGILKPEMVDRLIIMNVAHPLCLAREIANNPIQRKHSQYARDFQKHDAHLNIAKIFMENNLLVEYDINADSLKGKNDAEILSLWVSDPEVRKSYIEAFNRSDVKAMLNYYKRNYPAKDEFPEKLAKSLPKIKAPLLVIFGLKDTAILPAALNGTWEYCEKDMTLVTIPDSGHFVQQDAADLVTRSVMMWLSR